MEPVFEPAVAERAARCPPGRLFLYLKAAQYDLKLASFALFQTIG
jgi:hypothetical protein